MKPIRSVNVNMGSHESGLLTESLVLTVTRLDVSDGASTGTTRKLAAPKAQIAHIITQNCARIRF